MSKESSSAQSGGIGVAGLLGIVFVVLKLTGFIDWSWWWVTAPFWGGFVLVFVFVAIAAAIALCITLLDGRSKRRRV